MPQVYNRTVVIRTPKDDAPPYDPSLWEGGRDVFYLTRRAEMQRMERRLQHSDNTIDFLVPRSGDGNNGQVAAASQASQQQLSTHVQLSSAPRSIWGRLLAWVLRGGGKPPAPPQLNLAALSFDELFVRFQCALQRGDVGESSNYARELARRKAKVTACTQDGGVVAQQLPGGGDGGTGSSSGGGGGGAGFGRSLGFGTA